MDSRRVSSAKTERPKRARSCSVEYQTLRDSVNASQIQLKICEGELQKTKEQLKCLIHLVKRAWTGDIEASVHVANIVGVAPPSLQVKGDCNELVAVPKSPALNNWASLTIGLLNKVYIEQEQERKVKQLTYLNNREKFLDKQLDGYAQDPKLRSTEDVAETISRAMLKQLQDDHDADEKSNLTLQEKMRLQKEKLNQKHQIYKPHAHTKETPVTQATSNNKIDLEFAMEASGVRAKEALPENFAAEKPSKACVKQVRSSTEKPLVAKSSSTTRPPRPKTSRQFEKMDIKVQVSKKPQRPFSAKMAQVSKSAADANRRKSLESSFRREEYKLDQIERELKKTTSELQKKLNIDPKGFLNFR